MYFKLITPYLQSPISLLLYKPTLQTYFFTKPYFFTTPFCFISSMSQWHLHMFHVYSPSCNHLIKVVDRVLFSSWLFCGESDGVFLFLPPVFISGCTISQQGPLVGTARELSGPPSFSRAALWENVLLLLLLLSCPTLCDPIDGSPPGSAVPGILQARTLEWVAISFSNA